MARLRVFPAATMPATLRSRVSLVILFTNLVVLAGVAALLQYQTGYYQRLASEERTSARLAQLDSYLALRLENLDITCLNYVEWDEFWAASAEPSPHPPDWLEVELAHWLPERAGLDAAAWVAADGTLVWSYGSAADVSRLAALGPTALERPVRDRLAMEGGPALVVARATTGFPHKPPRGFLAIARRMDADMMTEFARTTGASTATAGPATASEPGDRPATATRLGYSAVRLSSRRGLLVSSALLLGRDGATAGSVRIEEPEPVASAVLPLQVGALIGTITLSALAGLVVGGTVVRLVQRPVDGLVEYVGRVGERAVQGEPYEPIAMEPGTPDELREMLQVVDTLTEHLSARQAELHAALEEIGQAEERLRVAVDESSEAKLLLLDGVIRLANPAAAAQFGSPPGGLLGLTAGEAFARIGFADEGERLLDFDELVALAGMRSVAVTVPAASGPPRWLEIRAVHHPERGEILLTSRDVTDLRRLAEIREEMLSLVSHDLRAPLTVISGYVDILDARPDDQLAAKAISGARAAIARMMELLEDVLSTARVEEMFAPQTMSPVDLADLAESVVTTMGMSVPQTIVLDASPRIEVRGEERRLRQVVVNLIANASRFSPPDSTIAVEVGCSDETALLSVEDSGPGIPPEDRQRVFERFVRLRRDAEAPTGVGLGLYVVRSIVAAHGGAVRIEDATGPTGARFVVELPRPGSAPAGEAPGDGG